MGCKKYKFTQFNPKFQSFPGAKRFLGGEYKKYFRYEKGGVFGVV